MLRHVFLTGECQCDDDAGTRGGCCLHSGGIAFLFFSYDPGKCSDITTYHECRAGGGGLSNQ